MLYLVATPIGNLSDITLRALEVLKKVDAILCEDTRHSLILLRRYGIEKPLIPHHKFNEKKSLEGHLNRLREGQELALISDAGTPCINDPGAILVQACIAEKLPFTAIPGPCSPIVALLLSGFDTARFQCIGFLPKKSQETLRGILAYRGTSIAFESPERLIDTLEDIARIDPERNIAVAREMSKTYEECQRGAAREVLTYYRQKGVKGEICLVIAEGKFPTEELPLDELIELLQEQHGLTLKEAIKLAANLLNTAKREVYKRVHTEH